MFDHHDINPELYEAKFGRRDLFYRVLCCSSVGRSARRCVIATNESYRRIAIERGGMSPERVFVVRSGPSSDKIAGHGARSAGAAASVTSSAMSA